MREGNGRPIGKKTLIGAALAIGIAGVALVRSGNTPASSVAAGATAPVDQGRAGPPRMLPSPEPARRLAGISGTVTTAKGRPIAKAQVTLGRNAAGSSPAVFAAGAPLVAWATADADGTFSFPGVPVDDYVIGAHAARFEPVARSLSAEELRAPVRLVLSRGGVEVRGRVLDSGGGAIASAEILASKRGAERQLLRQSADERGEFVFALAEGSYSVSARAPGYGRASRELVLVADVDDLVFRLDAGPNVGFSVVRGHGPERAPVFGAALSIRRDGGAGALLEWTSTNEQGRAAVALPEGRYVVDAVHAAGSAHATIEVRLEGPNEHVLELSEGLRVGGTVRSATDAPVASAAVEIVDASARRWTGDTDAGGRFLIRGLLPGHYVVRAAAAAYGETEEEIEVAGDRDDVDLTFRENGTIMGTVIDDAGRPVPGARVFARVVRERDYARVQGSTTAGADGSFALRVSPGIHALEANAGGDRGRTDPVAVGPGHTRAVVIKISASRFISGTVAWKDGARVAGAAVTATVDELGLFTRTSSARDGSFKLGPFPRGSRVVVEATPPQLPAGATQMTTSIRRRVTREDGSTHWQLQRFESAHARLVLVESRDVSDVHLVLERTGDRIEGRVVDKDGLPVEGARVAAVASQLASAMSDADVGRSALHALSDGDGRFILTDVAAGTYAVVAVHGSFGRVALAPVQAGATNALIRFGDRARLTGKVVDSDGDPVTAFSVTVRGSNRPGEGAAEAHVRVRDEDGAFEINPCPAGELSVAVTELSSRRTRSERIVVSPGEVGRVTVTFPSL